MQHSVIVWLSCLLLTCIILYVEMQEILFSIVAITFALFLWTRMSNAKINRRLPPGPWGFPILGHLPFLGKNPALKLMEWKKIYGPIISVRFGSYPSVVLNDINIIKEALSLKAFSGRPMLTNVIHICQSKGIIFNNGPRALEQRNFAIKAFKDFGLLNSYIEFRIQEEISEFLNHVRVESNKAKKAGKALKTTKLFQVVAVNSFWLTTIGERFDESDERIKHIGQLTQIAADSNESISGSLSWFLNWYASILHFLGINKAINAAHTFLKYMAQIIQAKRKDHVRAQPKHITHAYFDRVDDTVDKNSSFHESRQQQEFFTRDLFAAAITTTTATMDWLLLYLARDLNVQKKLQAEIDSLSSSTSTPTLADRDNGRMPYTQAVLQELLRISSVIPFSVFHRTTEDVEFHGFRIPKDTMIIPNLYGVHHDPEVWPEPDKFLPERFLDSEGQFNKALVDSIIPFSTGRRSCIGEVLARDQLFLLITSFFHKFHISCTSNVPSTEGRFGIEYAPIPFEINIRERFPSETE